MTGRRHLVGNVRKNASQVYGVYLVERGGSYRIELGLWIDDGARIARPTPHVFNVRPGAEVAVAKLMCDGGALAKRLGLHP